MYKFGLKLWSINENYIKEAVRLYNNDFYDYIELFVVPNSYHKFIKLWKNLDILYVIHAPHFRCGLNFAKKECFEKNFIMVEETLKFADELNAEIIIFHPGIDGDLQQTAFQFSKIKDSRVVVENKPYFALDDNLICNGFSPEQIQYVMQCANVGFCFDIGHAICSANAQNKDVFEYLKKFNNLNPKIYHLTDGNFKGVYDEHKHFGDGSFDIGKILKLLPSGTNITIETDKNFQDSLKDFEKDINYLNGNSMESFL